MFESEGRLRKFQEVAWQRERPRRENPDTGRGKFRRFIVKIMDIMGL